MANALLMLISGNYKVLNFSQARERLSDSEEVSGLCCLRHDVDYCLESALSMAQLEEKCGISSSYFFLVDSDHYNVLSVHSRDIISNIAQLGHEICLHFDISNYDKLDHSKIISFHVSCLELASQKKVSNISYHCPGVIGLNNLSLADQYEGLYNTYSEKFNSYFNYASDSLCKFKDIDILKKINARNLKNIHLLIHPIWWCESALTRDQKIHDNFERKIKYFTSEYNNILVEYGVDKI
ncbi:MAG: hypothetical protein WCJ92_00005 [Alphaproteobacteria bacterium]